MTILEAIQANPLFSMVTLEHINSKLIGRIIDGAANYTENDLQSVELVSADLYLDIALLPEFKEGQLSIKYNVSDLKARAKSIYTKYDDAKLSEMGPKIINVNVNAINA
ncbi:DUF6706 family protein [Lutibacter maritimus]|uniref:Uncharacterized protein n=1 Tax=Lutibacter maritimus TaxID=593133 RepID=A0A1I6NSB8_9FLAO|nr:DUF6706 family protein [Lutibacter maritimus]SFS30771.1 hypothetical protein SAMN04488006_0483 [Lutibacter maritimus]